MCCDCCVVKVNFALIDDTFCSLFQALALIDLRLQALVLFLGQLCKWKRLQTVIYGICIYSPAYLFDVVDERVAVLLPVALQRFLIGELVAAELQSDLETVAAEIVEILHSCKPQRERKQNRKS